MKEKDVSGSVDELLVEENPDIVSPLAVAFAVPLSNVVPTLKMRSESEMLVELNASRRCTGSTAAANGSGKNDCDCDNIGPRVNRMRQSVQ